jgi:hypothetical protein
MIAELSGWVAFRQAPAKLPTGILAREREQGRLLPIDRPAVPYASGDRRVAVVASAERAVDQLLASAAGWAGRGKIMAILPCHRAKASKVTISIS